jgi:hypothetical protein
MKFADEASEEEKSESANKLNMAVMAGESAFKEISDLKADLSEYVFENEKDNSLSNMLSAKMDGALDDLKSKIESGRDLLSKNELSNSDYETEVNLDNAPIVEEEKEEKVENVEEVNPENNPYKEFDLGDFNKTLDASLDEAFQNLDIKTDIMEDTTEEFKEDNKEENIEIVDENNNLFEKENNLEDLSSLFNDNELDKELDKISKDREELQNDKHDLNNLYDIPGVEEEQDSLPVVGEEEENQFSNVVSDYREIPEGFVKVIDQQDTLKNEHSRVA